MESWSPAYLVGEVMSNSCVRRAVKPVIKGERKKGISHCGPGLKKLLVETGFFLHEKSANLSHRSKSQNIASIQFQWDVERSRPDVITYHHSLPFRVSTTQWIGRTHSWRSCSNFMNKQARRRYNAAFKVESQPFNQSNSQLSHNIFTRYTIFFLRFVQKSSRKGQNMCPTLFSIG